MFTSPYERQTDPSMMSLVFPTRNNNTSDIPCRYYGSAKGCHLAETCPFSHCYPDFVKVCKYQDYCTFGNQCKFRHWSQEVKPGCFYKHEILIHGFINDNTNNHCPLEIIQICMNYTNTFIPGLWRYHPENSHKIKIIRDELFKHCYNYVETHQQRPQYGHFSNSYHREYIQGPSEQMVDRIMNKQNIDVADLFLDEHQLDKTIAGEYELIIHTQQSTQPLHQSILMSLSLQMLARSNMALQQQQQMGPSPINPGMVMPRHQRGVRGRSARGRSTRGYGNRGIGGNMRNYNGSNGL